MTTSQSYLTRRIHRRVVVCQVSSSFVATMSMFFAMLCVSSNVHAVLAHFRDAERLAQNLVCHKCSESFHRLTSVFHGGVDHEQNEGSSAEEENRDGEENSAEEKAKEGNGTFEQHENGNSAKDLVKMHGSPKSSIATVLTSKEKMKALKPAKGATTLSPDRPPCRLVVK